MILTRVPRSICGHLQRKRLSEPDIILLHQILGILMNNTLRLALNVEEVAVNLVGIIIHAIMSIIMMEDNVADMVEIVVGKITIAHEDVADTTIMDKVIMINATKDIETIITISRTDLHKISMQQIRPLMHRQQGELQIRSTHLGTHRHQQPRMHHRMPGQQLSHLQRLCLPTRQCHMPIVRWHLLAEVALTILSQATIHSRQTIARYELFTLIMTRTLLLTVRIE
jgi:hypothetical protein